MIGLLCPVSWLLIFAIPGFPVANSSSNEDISSRYTPSFLPLKKKVVDSLETLSQRHYENFPVGSFLLPKELRKPIHLIYAFARVADDLADEGEVPIPTRLARLDDWENRLKATLAGEKGEPFFTDLAEAVARFSIPPRLFYDLVTAFRMDARGPEFGTFEDVLFYCRHSANPIGRMLLQVFSSVTDENTSRSDAICSALQLANFWQDLSVDIKRNRFYIPSEELSRFRVTKKELLEGAGTENAASLLKFQIDRTRKMFLDGKPLVHSIDKRFRFELKLTYHGGMRILEKVESMGLGSLRTRPALTTYDWGKIFLRSLITR